MCGAAMRGGALRQAIVKTSLRLLRPAPSHWPTLPGAGRCAASSARTASAGRSGGAAAAHREAEDVSKLVVYYANHHVVPLSPDHRFPMEKYARTHANLANDSSLTDKMELRPGPHAQLRDLLLVHDEEYIRRFEENRMTSEEMRNVGFPWSPQLVARTFASAGGTIAATRLVLEGKGRLIAANLAGGTHHAFRARGEGYCIFNDIACAASVAIQDYGIQHVLVVDLDVHQGNGTAGIFDGDARVTTFDMFGDKNYPWKTRTSSTYPVPLPDGTTDEAYLSSLQHWLPRLIDRHSPQLVLFQAGVDALHGDSFGRLSLSRQGLLRRNHMVYSTCLQHSIPTVITMGGGYTKPMDASVDCHTDVYRAAAYRLHAWVRGQAGSGAGGGAGAA